MRKLVLHIGAEKTGTTTIQHFCNNNRNLLAKQNIIYPKVGFCDFAHFSLVAPFHPIDHNGAPLEFAPPKNYEIKEEWQPIKDLFSNQDESVVLLSAEHFSSRLKQGGLQKLKETIDWLGKNINIEVIFYIRRQDLYFSSWYSTHIKAGGKLSIEQAYHAKLNDNWFYNYFHIAESWASHFGREAIKIKVFEKEQMPQGLLNSFADTVGFTINDEFNMHINDDNVSWSSKMLLLAREINVLDKKQQFKNRYEKLNRLSKYFNDGNKSIISPAQSKKILDKYKDSNENLANSYLHRPDGKLFVNYEINYTSNWAAPESLSPEETLILLMKILRG